MIKPLRNSFSTNSELVDPELRQDMAWFERIRVPTDPNNCLKTVGNVRIAVEMTRTIRISLNNEDGKFSKKVEVYTEFNGITSRADYELVAIERSVNDFGL